jgi:hypothetical protein
VAQTRHRPKRPRPGTAHSSASAPTFSFVEDVEESYDPEADWKAWRRSPQQLGLGPVPTVSGVAPSNQAVAAAGTAAHRHLFGPGPRPVITAEVLTRAAAVTAYFGQVEVAFTKVPIFRPDLLIDALNLYPHPAAAACRWLVPALRNFFDEPRESADELWSRWHHEHNRLHRLSLSPSSISFHGKPPRHNLIDYQAGPEGTAPSRTHLERWGLTAHLIELPRSWTFEDARGVEHRPSLSVPRLNQLVRSTKIDCEGSSVDRQDTDILIQPLRTYLLRMAADLAIPAKERQRYRGYLQVVNESLLSGVLRRSTFRLHEYQVRQYDALLAAVQMDWRSSKTAYREKRLRVRQECVLRLGWRDSEQVKHLLGVRNVGDSTPRKIAALLLCMSENLELCHPQTVAVALAHSRKLYEGAWDPKSQPKRRGRPSKAPRI